MMNNELRPYADYKSIDLPWIDVVPTHWKILRNKNIMSQSKTLVGKNHKKYKLLSLTLNGVIARDMSNPKGKFPKEFDTYQVVSENDLVFCLFDIDETPRTVGLSPMKGMITGAYNVFNVSNANVRFLYYYYLALDNSKLLRPLYTGLRKVISADTFLRTKMPIPSNEEQDQIVKYLDNKLAKINKFIKAKKKLIAVLKEQKQAIINQAVTKGLDTKVKMKPSGIEWLGDVPEHWKVASVKRFAKSNLYSLPENTEGEESIRYLEIGSVGFGELKEEPVTYFFKDAPSRARRIVNCGDTIISTVRTYLKSMLYIDENIQDCIVSTGFCVLTPGENIYPKLFSYILASNYFVGMVSKNSIGISYPAINETKLMSLKIAVPDTISEQNKILDYILEHTINIDKQIDFIGSQIVLLNEYRNTLISDVVTGKIDIRNVVIAELDELNLDEQEFDEEFFGKEIIGTEEGDE